MTLLTEKEAAEKWCPMARSWTYAGDDTSVSINRNDIGMADDACNCIGSRCMAWRWADASELISYDVQTVGKPAGETNPPFSNCPPGYEVSSHWHGFYACRKELSRESPRGYCGAFGKVKP